LADIRGKRAYLAALKNFREGNYRLALEKVDFAIKVDGQKDAYNKLKFRIYLALGEYEKAYEMYADGRVKSGKLLGVLLTRLKAFQDARRYVDDWYVDRVQFVGEVVEVEKTIRGDTRVVVKRIGDFAIEPAEYFAYRKEKVLNIQRVKIVGRVRILWNDGPVWVGRAEGDVRVGDFLGK